MSSTVTTYNVREGVAYPLGATPMEGGVNFALFSRHAQKVELCLFDETGQREIARLTLPGSTDHVWHGWVEGLEPGALYGYRVHGLFQPQNGHRFNPHKLLLDPYAKAIHGKFVWCDEHYGYNLKDPSLDFSFDRSDNAAQMPKAVVVAPGQPPEPLAKPVPWTDTLIYELHVKGFTKLNELLPENLRGTYAGLGSEPVVRYLQELGITSVELLPVHFFVDEHFLIKRNLVNYWGYNTLNFFTPHPAYAATDDPVAEFKQMVTNLHAAGIEVLLDVVYNHTAEGNHLGPTLSFRGIDNCSYYCLLSQDPRFYVNDTGCGNTFNVKHPRVLQMVMDSLRYWATEMGVDGFRFDLASVLGREAHGFDSQGGFFDVIRQDPVLNTKKLIAEPWDIGPGGYQLGHFPPGWAEWNDRYRDTVRRYWRGDQGMLPEFARRIHGSSDLFEYSGRKPYSTINFVTSHDGFTLRDLVSYSQRHNHANKEQNNDGHHANFSHNFGVEGPTQNERIDALRMRQQRNFLATLLLSQGTPMLLAGDELSRTQQGNNNAYCQDNDINWLNWSALQQQQWNLREFVRNVIRVRREFHLLRSPFFIHKPEEQVTKAGYNIHWLNRDGVPMKDEEWSRPDEVCLGWMLESVVNSRCVHCLLSLFNAGDKASSFRLPPGWYWVALLDTAATDGLPVERYVELENELVVEEKSMMVLYGLSSQCDWQTDPLLVGNPDTSKP
ncbi:glycogen debranching enzyme GlgX [Saccharophagus sp. K07]|jgi:isoamylase|uniref:glycogen debranching protein GlgX n=1 Tax=Saccharophagus sp. K07 TaxID=2283636 RepID=UPI00165271D3|nr:glycogen debranching protein GlgX [Saccharophagus sp. K07]MBC6903886.1 glycogen debranching enzyme GlgX [Saccharophagus sp. K07]